MFQFKKQFLVLLAGMGLLLSACGGGTPTPPPPPTPTPPPCSAAWLISAINAANSSPATEDIIDLPYQCVYELTAVDNFTDGSNGLPSITSPIIINGNESTILRSFSSGTPAFRIFHVSNMGMITLNDLYISNGLAFAATTGATEHNAGGGIYNNNRVSLYGVVLENNHATLGGGIYNTIANGMTINSCTFRNNGADVASTQGERGGAIYSLSGATITGSTFHDNTATETGGAIENASSGRLAVSNSTFSGNSTTLLSGSAIFNSGEIIVLSYTTIANNIGGSPGAALMSGPDTITVRNSIIANNTGGNCSYPPSSSIMWENLDSDGTCNGFTITANPALDPLMNYGGTTLTHALTASSPAVDAADGNCGSVDQRGEPRPQGDACDLGAFELTWSGAVLPPTVIPSSVEGYVFLDMNGNGTRDAVEISASSGIIGANMTLMDGQCPGTNLVSASGSVSPDGIYGFGMLMPGTYCILTDPQQMALIPPVQEITVGNNDHLVDINFYMPDPGPGAEPAASNRCDLFDEMEMSLVLLNIPAETMVLPLYVKMEGGVPDYPELWEYTAFLGIEKSYNCAYQGFDDRLYCMFNIPPDMPGSAPEFFLYLEGCVDYIYYQAGITIPEPRSAGDSSTTCKAVLGEAACKAAGGTFTKDLVTKSSCDCP